MSTSNEIGKIYERPWGTYKTLEQDDGYQVKLIRVNPGGRLSLQRHKHRAERWIVVEGEPTITIQDQTQKYKIHDTVYIDTYQLHRLENLTTSPVSIIEVQMGTYLGEDDIERLEDVYGRK